MSFVNLSRYFNILNKAYNYGVLCGRYRYFTFNYSLNDDICRRIVDDLGDAVFRDTESTVIEICCGDYNLISHVIERYMDGLKDVINDPVERLRHIVNNNVSVLFLDKGMCENYKRVFGCGSKNAMQCDIYKKDTNNKLLDGAIENLRRSLKGMKFNNVLENPPYANGADMPFVGVGYDLATDNLIVINPAKWQVAESNQTANKSNMSYGQYRDMYVKHMKKVVFYPNCRDIFDIWQPDGITYSVIDKEEHEKCEVVNVNKDIKEFNSTVIRDIRHGETLNNFGFDVVGSLGNYNRWHFEPVNSTLKYQVYCVTKFSGYDWYETSKSRYVLSELKICDRDIWNGVSKDFKMLFSSDVFEEAQSFCSYLNTKLVRFMLMLNVGKLSNVFTDHMFKYVPMIENIKYDHIYTDEEVYNYFGVRDEHREIIDKLVKSRDVIKDIAMH